MEFPELPWFVREEVIKMVIEEEPKYCRVNKEWLKLVAAEHGLLFFGTVPRKFENTNTLFTQRIKKVFFLRSTDIHWGFIYNLRNLTDVCIHSFVRDELFGNEFSEFLIKYSQLFPLRNLEMVLDTSILDFSPLIKANQLYLRSIKISTSDQNWQSSIEKMTLPKLAHLDLGNLNEIDIQKLTKGMPSLKSLCLTFDEPEESILFTDYELPNLTKLDLTNSCRLVKLKINLANLPNIKSLILLGKIKLIGRLEFDQVEQLKANNVTRHLLNTIYPRFPKLKALNLDMSDEIILPNLWNLLRLLTNLIRARLRFKCEYTFDYLPPRHYTIAYLVLDGVFYTTPYLLTWLSTSFRLLTLDLHACNSSDNVFQSVPIFRQLSRLKIRARPKFINRFNQVFNSRTHPHIDSIEITSCKCEE